MEVLTEDGATPTLGRFLLWEVENLRALSSLPPLSEHFALFTAFDQSDIPTEEMLSLAKHLVAHGLAYLSCWGEDCERWHYAVDEVRDPDILDRDENDRNVIMTTWHDGEPLTQALLFFGRLGIPTPKYAVGCDDYLIACSPNYTDVIRSAFSSPK